MFCMTSPGPASCARPGVYKMLETKGEMINDNEEQETDTAYSASQMSVERGRSGKWEHRWSRTGTNAERALIGALGETKERLREGERGDSLKSSF